MSKPDRLPFELFAACPPGLEPYLLQEIVENGFQDPVEVGGGVTFRGDLQDMWRANLDLRGASRILIRIGGFMAFHLAQLDKRSRAFPWGKFIPKGATVRVEVVTNRKSKIYHAGAAIERIERALVEEHGATISPEAPFLIKCRIDDNRVIISLDSSGEGLHKRGFKQGVGKAPMRENMASLMLRAAGYDGNMNVVDPMCGSGTFLLEAADIATGRQAGRARRFAFENFTNHNADAYKAYHRAEQSHPTSLKFYGSDRNVSVIGMATESAKRAGVAEYISFKPRPLSELERPDGEAGLVIVNPPYGARVGKKKDLFALYGAFGDVMRERFVGWRVAMVTSEPSLAQATKLSWKENAPKIAHGGLKVTLYICDKIS